MFLLPIEEDNPTRNSAYAVWALIGLNVAAFLGMLVFGSADRLQAYGFRATEPSGQALITSMFLHVGVLHLLGNMFFLFTFGDNVEDMTGPVKFVLAYVLAGLFATGAHALTTSHPHIPLVGASGAVSGVVGMYLVLFPRAPFHTHSCSGGGAWVGSDPQQRSRQEPGLASNFSWPAFRRGAAFQFWA